jgi:2-polyprenyl-3-methyl-5-hydroxy-6-metoxy-1,4-benzoquinol methylase
MSKTPILPPGYDTKSDFYFERPRTEILPFLPTHCQRLLDVGCGVGAFGALVKQTREVDVWGVEPVKSAAGEASTRIDHVVNDVFDFELGLPAGTFDCVVFNDVLEHMVEPEQALRYARTLLAPAGVVVASIPNIRYLGVLSQLVFLAQWEYQDSGVLDKTHLRFFTKSSIVKMFLAEGYSVASICGINAYEALPVASDRLRRAYKIANALFPKRLGDMKFPQFAVVARNRSQNLGSE